MTVLGYDPYLTKEQLAARGAEKVELDELMKRADYVTLHCPRTSETFGLIDYAKLSLMKPNAYLLNTARGGIIEEDALYQALQSRQIAGAALDCFIGEPLTQPSRFADLDNVILAPHSIAWTNELFRDIGSTACRSLRDLAQGRRPHGIVNPEVFDRPSFQTNWNRLRLK